MQMSDELLAGARAVVVASPLPMLLCSRGPGGGSVLEASCPMRALAGLSTDEATTCEAWFSRLTPSHAPRMAEEIHSLQVSSKPVHVGNVEVTTADGQLRLLEYWVSLLCISSTVTPFCAWTAVDMTDQVRSDRSLVVALDELRQREQSLSKALRHRADILSSVSHDMRTPLTALRLSLEAVQGDTEGGRRTRMVHMAMQQAERLNRMIDSVLDQPPATERLRVPVELDGLLREVVTVIQPSVEMAKSSLLYQGVPGLVLLGDRLALENAFLNLLSNAVKYAPGRLEMWLYPLRGKAAIVIRDFGPGIAPDNLPSIFKPYVRLEQGGNGVGLGLYLVRQTIEEHGGDISVESEVGEGTTFTVCLPLSE